MFDPIKEKNSLVKDLKKICEENRLNKNLVSSFTRIVLNSSQPTKSNINKISKFFTAPLICSDNICARSKYNSYERKCGETVIKLCKFLDNHNGQEPGLFKFILRALSYLRGIQASTYPPDKAKLRTNVPSSMLPSLYTEITCYCQYQKIYDEAVRKCRIGGKDTEVLNFPGLSLTTRNSVTKTKDDWPLLLTEVKGNSGFVCDFFYCTGIKIDPDSLKGGIYHTSLNDFPQAIALLSKLFDVCLMPMPMQDKSNNAKRAKLREIAIFEWLFQQVSPFGRGTPTNVKQLISAILLKHGFRPNYACEHNDMNCFLSFSSTPSEYIKKWPCYTPYVMSQKEKAQKERAQKEREKIARERKKLGLGKENWQTMYYRFHKICNF